MACILGTPRHSSPHPFIGTDGAPCDSCGAAEAHPLHITAAPAPADLDTLPIVELLARYRTALQRIRALPDQYGHFAGADAATDAVRIAKEALGEK